MRLTEQFKSRLQKLAGIDPGKKAIPNKGMGVKDDRYIGCTSLHADNYNPEATESCNEGLVNSCCEYSCNGYGNPDAAIGDEDYGWGSAAGWGPWGAGCSETWMNNYCNKTFMQYTSWQTMCNACPCQSNEEDDPIVGCTCPDAWNYNPNATTYTYGSEVNFCMFLGCSDPEALNYDPTIPTQSVNDGYFNSPPFDDTEYCESTGENVPAWGLGASNAYLAANEAAWPELCEYPEIAECANYPAACCLQQVYGQDIFGTTVPWQGEEVTVPSAAECEGMTLVGINSDSTPWPHGDNTMYDGVEYTHNPNNSFEQGCCYPLV